jgi:hypothetical protein
MPQRRDGRDTEWRTWTGASLATSAALTVALAWGSWTFFNIRSDLPLPAWQEKGLEVMLVTGTVGFLVRTLILVARLMDPRMRP